MAPAYVKDAGLKTAGPFSGTTNGSFASLPIVGNHVIVGVALYESVDGVGMSTITDNQSNSYTENRDQGDANGDNSGCIYSTKVATSSGTYTITIDPVTASSLYAAWSAVEFSGLDTSTWFDQSGANNSQTGDANVTASGANSTTSGVALGVASVSNADSDINIGDTPPSGYTNIQVNEDSSAYIGYSFVYKIYSSSETSAATWAHDNISQSAWVAVIATYKAASGGGGGGSTGATAPTAAETVSESPWSDDTWVNPANIYGAGEASVTASTFDAGDQTYVLKAYTFGFAIPTGATIVGVECVINARYATALGKIDLVQLLNTSRAKVGTNLAATPVDLTTSAANYTFGGSSNTWGNSLTEAWVEDADFGVAIGCIAGGTGNNNVDVYIDSVTLNVYYNTNVSINLSAATLTLSGQVVDQQSGAVSKTLSAASLSLAGQIFQVKRSTTLYLAAAALALAGQIIDQQSGAVSKTLSAANLSLSGQIIDQQSGAITKNLSAASLALTGQIIDQQSGAVSKTLSAANLALSGQIVDQQSGAVSKTLSAAALSTSGQILTVQMGGGPLSVNLLAAALSLLGQIIDQQSGAVSKTLQSAVLSVAGQTIDQQSGAVSKALQAAVLSATGQVIDQQSGAVSKSLAAVTLTLLGQIVDQQSGAITKNLSAAALTLAGQIVDQQSGAVTKSLSPAILQLTGQSITIIAPPPIVISLAVAQLSLGGQTLTIIGGAPPPYELWDGPRHLLRYNLITYKYRKNMP